MHEVERREQHLRRHEAVGAKGVVVHLHEAALADRRDGLEGDGVAGDGWRPQPEVGQTGGDGAGGDHHDGMTGVAQAGDFGAELDDRPGADLASASVTDEVPIFATTIIVPLGGSFVLVLEAEPPDVDGVTVAGAGAGQGLVDAELLQAAGRSRALRGW